MLRLKNVDFDNIWDAQCVEGSVSSEVRKRTICWRKLMVMSVYLVLKFSSGLKGLRREGKRSETISAPVVPAHKRQKLTSKKSVKLFDKIVAWAFEQLLSWLTLTRKLLDRFYITISTWKSVFEDGAETPHSWSKGNSNEHLCWHSSKYWKRPKSFREHNNLWWIMVFFNTTQKVNANPCTGRAPVH